MGGAARAGGRAGARARGWRRRGRLLPERRRGGAPAEPRAGGPPPLALAAVTDGPTWCHPWRRSLVRRCSSHPFPLVFVCGWRRAAGAGLLLLTNDNAWINKLTHPKYVAAARAKPRRPRARPRAVPARRGLSVGCYGRFFFFLCFTWPRELTARLYVTPWFTRCRAAIFFPLAAFPSTLVSALPTRPQTRPHQDVRGGRGGPCVGGHGPPAERGHSPRRGAAAHRPSGTFFFVFVPFPALCLVCLFGP